MDGHSKPRDDSTCRRDGFPRSPRRTPAGNRTTARGRFPGFRVNAFVRLPKARASVAVGRPLAGHSCGGSRGLKPRSLNPFREPHACLNANLAGSGGSMRDFPTAVPLPRKSRRTADSSGRIVRHALSAAKERTLPLWRMAGCSNSPHFPGVRMKGIAQMEDRSHRNAATRTRSARPFKGIGAVLQHCCATKSCRASPRLPSSHNLRARLPFTN
jgi:hypothetical protein